MVNLSRKKKPNEPPQKTPCIWMKIQIQDWCLRNVPANVSIKLPKLMMIYSQWTEISDCKDDLNSMD